MFIVSSIFSQFPQRHYTRHAFHDKNKSASTDYTKWKSGAGRRTYSEAVGVTALWKFPGQQDAGLSGQID